VAYFDCHFFSDVLGLSVSASVLLPQKTSRQIGMAGTAGGGRFPTLYLLHGLSDDHTIWMRRTSIERYAAARNLAVVMPAAARSYYQDMASGPRYWTYLSEELPAVMRGFFPLSEAREDTFAAGLSMGGYGALRLALDRPESYAAAASFSGALDVVRRCREAGREGSLISRAEMAGIFGDALDVSGTQADLAFLAQKVAACPGPAPRLFISCGTEDPLLRESRAFREHLESLHLACTYEESPGTHEWGYWDAQIQRVLEWLPIRG
jgi:putative tributyrin esterase